MACPFTPESGGGAGQFALLEPNHHGVRTNQMLDAGVAESSFLHPAYAIGTRIVEAPLSLNEHVEAHHQAECTLFAVIVDDGL